MAVFLRSPVEPCANGASALGADEEMLAEFEGVACAVGVDCWEDIMLQLCGAFAGRSLRRSAFAVL